MEKIKTLRSMKNLTQSRLAIESGVSQSYINELERGKKNNPSVVVLVKLAKALGVSIMELLDNTDLT